MAYLTEQEVRRRARLTTELMHKSAREILAGARADSDDSLDVFLSHSSNEPEEILLGIKKLLEDVDMTVYVDKYTDPNMSLVAVTSQTAETLRRRMRQSKALLYVYSQYSTKSRWMPWELGYFDGLKGKVGVIPVLEDNEKFEGEEYLNLYPCGDQAPTRRSDRQVFWINKRSFDEYARLDLWVNGAEAIRKHD